MAGALSPLLQGWCIPVVAFPLWDHTYVVSSCGLRWGCWGAETGGTGLSYGTGNSIIADCLSQSNSEAGIVYLRTGVCHQTANRILHPAGITVAGCRGYNVSALRYGTYGRRNWPEMAVCYPPSSTIVASLTTGRQPTSKSGALSSMIENYNSRVTQSRQTALDEEAIRSDDLSALVEMALG